MAEHAPQSYQHSLQMPALSFRAVLVSVLPRGRADRVLGIAALGGLSAGMLRPAGVQQHDGDAGCQAGHCTQHGQHVRAAAAGV